MQIISSVSTIKRKEKAGIIKPIKCGNAVFYSVREVLEAIEKDKISPFKNKRAYSPVEVISLLEFDDHYSLCIEELTKEYFLSNAA